LYLGALKRAPGLETWIQSWWCTHPHVVNPLIGRLKGETGEQFHTVIMARVTKSGVMTGRWEDTLMLKNYFAERGKLWTLRIIGTPVGNSSKLED
jgi:hypothetical protein